MKKSGLLTVLLVVFFLSIVEKEALCQIQRQVNQSTLRTTTYAIPAYIDESELSELDWVYLENDDLEECAEHIIKGDTLTIIKYDPKLPRWENDYQYEMGKSVTSVWGTALYYHDGTEYSRLNDYDPNYILSAYDIESYGIHNDKFEVGKEFVKQFFQMQGFQISEQGDFIIASLSGVMEIAINLVEYIEEYRFFGTKDNEFFAEEGNKLNYFNRTEYRKIDSYIIPLREITVEYDELPSGIPYEITDTLSYLFYQVIKNGNTLVKTGDDHLFVDCRNSVADLTGMKEVQQANINIYPNPAKEQITISLPLGNAENVDVKLFNMLGVNVLSQQAAGEQINMDIHSLQSGVYMVRCIENDKVITKRFIKQ